VKKFHVTFQYSPAIAITVDVFAEDAAIAKCVAVEHARTEAPVLSSFIDVLWWSDMARAEEAA